MLKIKYLSGKRKDQIADLEDVQAKGLIEDGICELVVEADPMEVSLKAYETKVKEIATKGLEDVYTKAQEYAAKGLNKISSASIRVGPEKELEDPTGGFKSMSHFLTEVKNSSVAKAPTPTMAKWIDVQNKITKSTTGNTEGSTSNDSGYAVPVQYNSDMFKMYGNVPDYSPLLFQVPMQTSVAKIPVLKNYVRSNTTAANGVVANVISEQSNITQSKTNWEQISLQLGKESIMVPVTNELLEDNNVALGSVVAEQAVYQITKAKNGGIISGSSAYTGIKGHAATKLVGRAVGNQISFADVLGMYAAFAFDDADYNSSYWIAHPTVIPQLGNMTSGNYNIYFPPGGAQDGSVGRLMGRPILVTGWASTLGTSGDLMLVDFHKYVAGYRNGLQSMVSPHVFFLTDETAFRFTERVCGKPGLTGLITLEDGSTQVSPFVELGQVGGLS